MPYGVPGNFLSARNSCRLLSLRMGPSSAAGSANRILRPENSVDPITTVTIGWVKRTFEGLPFGQQVHFLASLDNLREPIVGLDGAPVSRFSFMLVFKRVLIAVRLLRSLARRLESEELLRSEGILKFWFCPMNNFPMVMVGG